MLPDLFSNAACTDIEKGGWNSLSAGNYLNLRVALVVAFWSTSRAVLALNLAGEK